MKGLRLTSGMLGAVLAMTVAAQSHSAAQGQSPADKPEEIVVTGERLALYQQMLSAEKVAYDTFNQFNDVKRFAISCSTSKPTGRLLALQTCAPEFEIQATRSHALDYLNSLRNSLNPAQPDQPTDGSVDQSSQPVEAAIAKDLPAYRNKLKEVATQHPEFRDAVVRYVELRKRYEAAGKTGEK